MDGKNLGKYDRREPHVLVSDMGILKAEDSEIMHLLPLVNVNSSAIMIRMWLERLLALLKEEGKKNFPAFCEMEG